MKLKVLQLVFTLIYITNRVHGAFNSVCVGRDIISDICNEFGLTPQCNSKIYCYGELLCTIQLAHIYNDSKTFVDKKLKYPEDVVLANFQQWKADHPDPIPDDIRPFVEDNFGAFDLEFKDWIPKDHNKSSDLKIMEKIKDVQYREWAAYLHDLWLVLGREMKEEVIDNPSLYSIIPVRNPIIVPGGRFREFYYWDSYWVIHGLLLSEMYVTVRGMLSNFIDIVDRFGFVPNGGRIYYSGRSQPPLLTPMVLEYVKATGDFDFVRQSLPTLEKEFNYWITNHKVKVGIYELYIYIEKTCGPRPESFSEDMQTASTFTSDKDRENLYSEIKAAACSGMDFSSRWYVKDGTNNGQLQDLKTRSIVPVDLNAWLYYIAKILSEFNFKIGTPENDDKGRLFNRTAETIKKAIDAVLWNPKVGIWQDYDLINKRTRNYFVASNFLPLYVECYDLSKRKEISAKVQNYISALDLDSYVSVPNTLVDSSQQWDYPNVWPPMEYIAVMGLDKLGTEESQEMAYSWAARYIRSNYIGFHHENKSYMYEKYSAIESGLYGNGGEYDIQLGFGWSNGVALFFLNKYGDRLSSTDEQLLHSKHAPTNSEYNSLLGIITNFLFGKKKQ